MSSFKSQNIIFSDYQNPIVHQSKDYSLFSSIDYQSKIDHQYSRINLSSDLKNLIDKDNTNLKINIVPNPRESWFPKSDSKKLNINNNLRKYQLFFFQQIICLLFSPIINFIINMTSFKRSRRNSSFSTKHSIYFNSDIPNTIKAMENSFSSSELLLKELENYPYSSPISSPLLSSTPIFSFYNLLHYLLPFLFFISFFTLIRFIPLTFSYTLCNPEHICINVYSSGSQIPYLFENHPIIY